MDWRHVAGCLVAVVTVVTTPKVLRAEQVSEPQPVRAPRPVGVLRSWTNLGDPRRTPIEERLAPEVAGRGEVIPPQIRRQGFIPRFSFIQEYTDNLLFTSDDRFADLITVFSPGLHYITEGPRWRLDADYTFEATVYANNPELNNSIESQTALLSGNFQLTKRTRLQLSERFQSFEDPTEQRVPGILPSRSTTRANSLTLSGEHNLTPLMSLRLRYGNDLLDFEDPQGEDSLISEAAVGLQRKLTRRDLLGLEYRFRFFDFDKAGDIQTHTVMLDHEHQVSETLILKGQLGVVRTVGDVRSTDILGLGSLRTSVKMAIFEIGYERVIEGGIGSIFVSQSPFGSALIRLAKGFQMNAGVAFTLSNAQGGGDEEFQTLGVNAGLAYALRPWLIVRLGYGFIREEDKETAIETTANKITMGLTASF